MAFSGLRAPDAYCPHRTTPVASTEAAANGSGPGPDLTHVASRLPGTAIARALVHATPPMPSSSLMPES